MLNHLLGSHSWAKAEADLKPEFLTANLRLFKMFTQFSLKSLLGKMRQRCAVRTAGEGGRLRQSWRTEPVQGGLGLRKHLPTTVCAQEI